MFDLGSSSNMRLSQVQASSTFKRPSNALQTPLPQPCPPDHVARLPAEQLRPTGRTQAQLQPLILQEKRGMGSHAEEELCFLRK